MHARFNQDGYKVVCKLESFLCHPKPKPDDYKDIFQLYSKDLDQECLNTQLHTLHSNIPGEVISSQKVGISVKDVLT